MTGRLRRIDFALIYALQMLGAVSISTMFSLLPSVGRISGIPDALIVTTQALSATTWIFVAGMWSRMAERKGRKFVILVGCAGLFFACFTTGAGVLIAVSQVVAPMVAFVILIAARSANGAIGLASNPAGQAYVIERTDAKRRTVVLSSLASSNAIGTIVGPAVAPFLTHIPGLGLAGPMFVIAGLAAIVFPAVFVLLPNDRPVAAAKAQADFAADPQGLWRMPRLRALLAYSAIFAVATSGTLQTIGFLVIDTLKLPPEEAQPYVGEAIAVGAVATLVFQLVVIPLLKPSPRTLMAIAPVAAMAGLVLLAFLPDYRLILVAMVIGNIGFAAARPGVASAASLSLPLARQTEIASAMLSTASFGIVVGPVLSVWLYSIWQPLPFAMLAALTGFALIIGAKLPHEPA